MIKRKNIGPFTVFLLLCSGVLAQPKKEINTQSQSWISVNATQHLTKQWGVMADVHYRSNHFFATPNFLFVRGGITYWLTNNASFAAGFAHMWLAPTKTGFRTYANENRLFQQAMFTQKIGSVLQLQKLRLEERWQEKIDPLADTSLHINKFTTRFRALLSYTIPVAKNPHFPALVLSDELCVQFGKEVVYNTFDQNRLFVGIKQNISKALSFDLGYMQVYQQKASGYQYDDNQTFRCFFYYSPEYKKL